MERKILVVDDDVSVLNLFEDFLRSAGYEVRSAENSGQAMEILDKEDIEVIFLDLKLFGMNGIELCRQIRKHNPVSIIYAITGWAALFEVKECRKAGFDDFFTKPIKVKILSRAVEDAFEKLDRWKSRLHIGTAYLYPS
jgi:DNA-binding response OmpR family regulator